MKENYIIILFYKFVDIADPKAFADIHRAKCRELALTGRLIVGEEGVNGTMEGTQANIRAYIDFFHSDPNFANMIIKESAGNGKAFPKLKIKVRNEIVTLGAGRFDVATETAKEVTVEELQKMYETDEDFVVLDLRNDYEIASGKFDKTVDPGLHNFRDLPAKLDDIKDLKNKKVVAVCTGGIRCEKATCLLTREGFTNVYQLKDGIHTYMQKYPGQNFKGTLFVFDNRMTTDVVPVDNKIIVGLCIYCKIPTEQYYADDTIRPSRKVLCCNDCYLNNKSSLRMV